MCRIALIGAAGWAAVAAGCAKMEEPGPHSMRRRDVCVETECEREPRAGCDTERCVERRYLFELPEERDESVYAACVAALDADRACGWPASDAWCERPARVYRPEVARAAYECLAALPCEDIPGGCWDSVAPPPGTLGDELCDAMDLACGVDENCDDDVRRDWNEAEPYYRADVVAAVRSCFGEGECRDIQACIDSWSSAATGPDGG